MLSVDTLVLFQTGCLFGGGSVYQSAKNVLISVEHCHLEDKPFRGHVNVNVFPWLSSEIELFIYSFELEFSYQCCCGLGTQLTTIDKMWTFTPLACNCPDLLFHKTFYFLWHDSEDVLHRLLAVHVEVSPEHQAQGAGHH